SALARRDGTAYAAVSARELSDVLFLRGVVGAEHLAHLVEERLRLGMCVLAGGSGELLEQLALLARQLLRHLDGDAHVLVAALVAVEARNSLSAQPEHFPALRSRGNL